GSNGATNCKLPNEAEIENKCRRGSRCSKSTRSHAGGSLFGWQSKKQVKYFLSRGVKSESRIPRSCIFRRRRGSPNSISYITICPLHRARLRESRIARLF